MNLIKCLFIVEVSLSSIQKIAILSVILMFIPIAIYTFDAQEIVVSDQF